MITVSLLVTGLTGCFVEGHDDAHEVHQPWSPPDPLPIHDPSDDWYEEQLEESLARLRRVQEEADAAEQRRKDREEACQRKYAAAAPGAGLQTGPADLNQGCRTGRCAPLPVQVHYLLPEPVRNGWLVVEAADDPFFFGSTVTGRILSDFTAAGPGISRATMLWVEPGEYYVRAWLSHDRQHLPAGYGDLYDPFASPAPAGLSAPTPVTVRPRETRLCPDLLEVLLDRPPHVETEEESGRLRILLSAEPEDLPAGRPLRIALYRTRDFAMMPDALWQISSDQLLIRGKEGRTDYISPALDPGSWFVEAWVDDNDNGFFDAGEHHAILTENGVPVATIVSDRRTSTILLHLENGSDLP